MSLPPGFPPQAGAARHRAILAALLPGGAASWTWSPIVVRGKGHTIVIQVLTDGIKIGGVRMAGSANLAQMIADRLGALLQTPRINDLAWQWGCRIQPQIVRPVSASTAALVEESRLIDAAIQDPRTIKPTGGPVGLIAPIGKPWVLSKKMSPTAATLYGWQLSAPIPGEPSYRSPSTPGIKIIQSLSAAHSPAYEDYSSLINLVHRQCVVDGEPADLATVLQDPNLSWLVSHEGPVPVRQPGVPVLLPIEDVATPASPTLVASNTRAGSYRDEAESAKEALEEQLRGMPWVSLIDIERGSGDDDWSLLVGVKDDESVNLVPTRIGGVPIFTKVMRLRPLVKVSGVKPPVLCPNRPDRDSTPRQHLWDFALQLATLPLSGMLGTWIAKRTGRTPSPGRWT